MGFFVLYHTFHLATWKTNTSLGHVWKHYRFHSVMDSHIHSVMKFITLYNALSNWEGSDLHIHNFADIQKEKGEYVAIHDKIASSLMKLPNNEKLYPSRYVKPYLREYGSAYLHGCTFSVFSNSKSPAGYFVGFQVPFRLVFPSTYPQSKVSTPSPSVDSITLLTCGSIVP